MLNWITQNSSTKPQDWEIAHWTTYQEQRTPSDVETKGYFAKLQSSVSETREDILTWFDLLDADDFVSYGGKP